MEFDLDELVRESGAELLKAPKNTDKKNDKRVDKFKISTDSRTIEKGDIYLPLKGANFDGEKFCENALLKGAVGCFVTRNEYPQEAKFVLKVNDTLVAYLSLAKYIRSKFNPKTIAITGSSGKTTTKEMVYSVVNKKFKTQKTLSNHNNEIGLCQTVLTMPEDTEVLIIEMGMRGLGEIELLSKYASADYSIITNVGSAHIGRLGSLDNIAKAKCEITKFMRKSGTLIAHNSERIQNNIEFRGEKIYFSIKDVEILKRKTAYSKFIYKAKEYELYVEGDYNIENALSAIEIGFQLGMGYAEIKEGLASYRPIEKRWELEKIKGYNVINDSYNANPESMKATVATFIELYNNSVVVLGNMGELGENEVQFHREVGIYLSENIKNMKNVKFLTVGVLANEIGLVLEKHGIFVKNFNSNKDAALYILDKTVEGTTIFLKASRTMKFEEIIEYIKGEN